MLLRDLPFTVTSGPQVRARDVAAAALQTLSAGLAVLARRLAHVEPVAAERPMIEFYAEAGAPEGALYVDGRLVGHLQGVQRL